jgi:hypothetical protein
MSTQFDVTTKTKTDEHICPSNLDLGRPITQARDSFIQGRDSVKQSLKILAQALEFYTKDDVPTSAQEAIDAVKSRGDWPL